jgi:hypothetical protein
MSTIDLAKARRDLDEARARIAMLHEALVENGAQCTEPCSHSDCACARAALAATAADVATWRAAIESAAVAKFVAKQERSVADTLLAKVESAARAKEHALLNGQARYLIADTRQKALEEAARVADRHALKWQALAVDDLDKANDACVEADHVWRRDAHQHKTMGSVGVDIATELRRLATTPDTPADDPHEPAFYRSAQTGTEHMPAPTVDAPAAKPETCAYGRCAGVGRWHNGDEWVACECPAGVRR